MGPNQISCCLDCVHPIDESGQCLIAKMFEKPVNPEHGCSWRVPLKRKDALTNGDRIRQMTDEELVKSIGLACKRCAYYKVGHGSCEDKECEDGNLKWLKLDVSEDAGTD